MSFLAELRRRWWLLLVAGVLVVLFFATRLAEFYTDVLWFDSLGYLSVYWTLLGTRIGVGALAAVVVFALLATNLLIARRAAPAYRIPSQQEETIERYREALEPYARPLLLGVAVVVGLLSGLSMSGEWRTVLLFLNGGAFGLDDPHFERDVGYFVFQLPFWELVNSWLFTTLAITIVLTAVAHYLFGGIRPQSPGQKITPQVNVHLSLLLAALVAVRAWGFVLDQHLLSYSERGTVTGLSYTDVNAQLLAFQLLAVIAAIIAVLFLANVWVRTWLLPAGGVAILLIAAIVLAGIYPAVIQRFQVAPQELEREREFIARNLDYTRFGFGLRFGDDGTVTSGPDVEQAEFAAEPTLEGDEVQAEAGTLGALRMWDPATLQTNFSQQQELRQFYEFRDVDVDRYQVENDDGETELTQVMISAREINERTLPQAARTWENQHLVFTHGFGVVAADVNKATRDGDPVLMARDMPMRGIDELVPENPRIYFGERSPEYSIIGTGRDEFDYPADEQEIHYRYTGTDGVPTGTVINRLAFALRFGEINFLLSGLIDSDSRVLFERSIRDRVERVAPFLELDHDPYLVVVDDDDGGRIKWIQDAYTISNMVPYSERVELGELTLAEQRELEAVQVGDEIELRERVVQRPGIEGQANYIRNSVKVVVDAYDGTVELYVADDDDPLINAWREIFPDIFSDIDDLELGEDQIRSHFRYPEDIFRVQAAMFERYHVRDPGRFYRGDDVWIIPRDAAFTLNQGGASDNPGEERPLRPHYQLMRLPDGESEEFTLVQQFLPQERPNLSGILAARNDGENLGELVAYDVPRGDQTLGPGQLLARLDRESALANLIGVWNESNAQVLYGNTLILPVGDSLVYAQPLFLQPEASEALPQLTIVAVSDAERLVWSTSLGGALQRLYGDAAADIDVTGIPFDEIEGDLRIPDELREEEDFEDPAEVAPDPEEVDGEIAEILQEAQQASDDADEALADGDLGEYQRKNQEARELVAEALSRMGGDAAEEAEDEETAGLDD